MQCILMKTITHVTSERDELSEVLLVGVCMCGCVGVCAPACVSVCLCVWCASEGERESRAERLNEQ